MELFSKLFSKKEEKQKLPKEEPFHFDSPYCRFYYISNPNTNEFGYEGEIERNEDDLDELTVYLDTDSPETLEAGICYAKLHDILSGRENFSEVKALMANYFLSKPDFTSNEHTAQELINKMFPMWIGIFRNGDLRLSFDTAGIYAENISVLLKADGTKEITYTDYYHKDYCDIL